MAAGGVKAGGKLGRARARLMMGSPWLGTLASSLTLIPDDKLMAFEAEGERLRYRPDFFKEAGVEVLEFVLANAALHRILDHRERRGGRNRRLWQLATDHAINALLAENGFFIPDFARGFERYGSRYAESIYEELYRENPPSDDSDEERDQEKSEEAPERREGEKDSGPRGEERKSESVQFEERLEEERLRQITERYLKEGELPEGIERLLPELAHGSRDWRQELHRYFDPFFKNDYRFSPPNPKHLYRGVSLPSLNSERLEIVIAVDSSGSVDRELMQAFLAEIDAIMEQFPDYRIDLIVADDRIRSHQRFESGEPLSCLPEGGGGTDFRPVFDYIDERMNPPKALLYFTDGAGIFPAEEPRFDVLWVLDREANVPFGERVLLSKPNDP